MLTVLSPAKTLDYDTPPTTATTTLPRFLSRAERLIEDARQMSPEDISNLMGVSSAIAELNFKRFVDWHPDFNSDNAKQAVLAFKGDVYTGLAAETLSQSDLEFAQQHVRILSGLYGLLKPLDLMQAYRLEMGLKFSNTGGKNLYQFWGDDITSALNADFIDLSDTSPVLVNLASNEYFKAVRPKQLNADVITPVFRDLKGGKYKVISFYAKKARGLMARYIIDNRITDISQLRDFCSEGYRYSEADSTAKELVFLRDEAP